jgi:hypothetical protein
MNPQDTGDTGGDMLQLLLRLQQTWWEVESCERMGAATCTDTVK